MKGTTKSQGKKDKNDKFYTNAKIAKECIQELDLSKFDLIIEPSAGSGNFSNQIKDCLAFDIEPEHESIKKQDWLKINFDDFKKNQKILVIGNPPFGEQNSLAVDFFNHSAKIADTIAFILPLPFKKDSVQNRLNLNFSFIKEKELPLDSFTLNNSTYKVPTVFQIWKRTISPRKKKKLKMTTDLFEFTTNQEADIRIQRVGGNTGKATLLLDGSKTSNYFIKNKTTYSNEEFVEIINNITFPSINFTVGPKSLPKGELILEIEEYLKNDLSKP